MNELRTEAGRRLLDQITPPVNEAAAPEEAWVANSWARRNDIEDAIIAIEAEARAQGALHERLISEGEEAARSATPSSEETGPAMAQRLSVPRLGTANNAMLPLATPDNAGRSPIDVERLARAMHNGWEGEPCANPSCPDIALWRRDAANLATEYAHLSESTGSEDGAS